MFYGLNGPPEIDAVLMSSDSRKKGGKNVSVLSVCIRVPGNLCAGCAHVRLCLLLLMCAIQMGLSEGFAHANEAT